MVWMSSARAHESHRGQGLAPGSWLIGYMWGLADTSEDSDGKGTWYSLWEWAIMVQVKDKALYGKQV